MDDIENPLENSSSDEIIVQSVQNQKKKSFRFQKDHLPTLLQATIAINPFNAEYGETETKWTDVSQLLHSSGIEVGWQGCQRKVMALLDAHKKCNQQEMLTSGASPEYTDMKRLLDEIEELEVDDLHIKHVMYFI